MARIAGVDIPREKRLEISLTYIFGIGVTTSQKICDELKLDRNTKVSTPFSYPLVQLEFARFG